MSADGKAIRIEGIRRSFGRKKVLRGVSACADKGKVVGLLGRNGEGKTTLFKILLDMLAADAGECEILGMKPDGTGAVRRHVGYIPERPSFHDFMTIREVFELRGKFFESWDPDKASALSAQLELDLGTRIDGASKGTLGKIAWVCAAAHAPSVFLLDEPTSGLDSLVRDDVLGQLIGELHESGGTFLIANHRMEELAGILDEVWVLSEGVIRGVHEMEKLRTEACRITGRLKEKASLPDDLPLADLNAEGPLVDCAVLERSAADRLAASGALESMERKPLPIGTTLKLLLKCTQTNQR